VLDGIDTDKQLERAKEKFQTQEPTKEQITQVSKESVAEASSISSSILSILPNQNLFLSAFRLNSLVSGFIFPMSLTLLCKIDDLNLYSSTY